MSSMAIASSKISTLGLALASPSTRVRVWPRRKFCTARDSAAHSFQNPGPIIAGDCSQVAKAEASPGGRKGWNCANSPRDSLGGKRLSSLPTSRGRKGSSFVPARAATGVAAAEGGAADASATATATTTGDSSEDLLRKGESYFLTDSRPVILFDGICNFCNSGVNFMLDNDPEGKFRFASLQSDAGRALLVKSDRSPDDLTSIVLVCKDRSYVKSEAVLRMSRDLKFPYTSAGFIGLLVPLFIRDAVYDQVANNRYDIYGTTNTCRLSDPRFPERFVE